MNKHLDDVPIVPQVLIVVILQTYRRLDKIGIRSLNLEDSLIDYRNSPINYWNSLIETRESLINY